MADDGQRNPVPGTGARRKGTKDVRPLLAAAKRQGFQVSQRRGHIEVVAPDGRSKKISASPSDVNAHLAIQRELEGLGVKF